MPNGEDKEAVQGKKGPLVILPLVPAPRSWRHKDEHLLGTHQKVVEDCNARCTKRK
jgi:hypothetical protein